jgi:hypothetical protein
VLYLPITRSPQHTFDLKDLNISQRRWIELLNDYDCEICYHPGKANVVADALSRKTHVILHSIQVQTNLREHILLAQQLSVSEENLHKELSCGVELLLETKPNGLLYFNNRL